MCPPPTWKTRIPSDMYSPTWETHIPSYMCSPTLETHIPSDMCFPTRETHIPSDMCSSTRETHIPSDMCFPPGKHISLVICVPLAPCVFLFLKLKIFPICCQVSWSDVDRRRAFADRLLFLPSTNLFETLLFFSQ